MLKQNEERIRTHIATEVREICKKKLVGTIDMTPTWSALTPMMLLVYSTTDNMKTKKEMAEDFDRMAEAADRYNQQQAQNKAAIDLVNS